MLITTTIMSSCQYCNIHINLSPLPSLAPPPTAGMTTYRTHQTTSKLSGGGLRAWELGHFHMCTLYTGSPPIPSPPHLFPLSKSSLDCSNCLMYFCNVSFNARSSALSSWSVVTTTKDSFWCMSNFTWEEEEEEGEEEGEGGRKEGERREGERREGRQGGGREKDSDHHHE